MPDRKLLEKNYYSECSRVLEIYATFATRALFYQLNESVPQKIFSLLGIHKAAKFA